VDHAAQVRPPRSERALELRDVANRRLEAAEDRGELLPAVAERRCAVGEEQAQEPACVRVKRCEHLVGVHVRRGLGARDRRSLFEQLAVVGPGVDLDRHVLQAGARP
jgi:hypothetical protein